MKSSLIFPVLFVTKCYVYLILYCKDCKGMTTRAVHLVFTIPIQNRTLIRGSMGIEVFEAVPFLKGSVSQKLRPRLLYIIRKLSL